jgi:hypothetical protein
MYSGRFYGGFGILFDAEDGVSTFIRKVSIPSPGCTSPLSREQYSSQHNTYSQHGMIELLWHNS